MSELAEYEAQLSEVKDALAKDPSNEDLKTLRDELQNLIDLTKQYSAPAASPSKASNTSSAKAPSSSTSRHDSPSTSSSAAAAGATPVAVEPPPASASLAGLRAGDDCLARYAGDSKFYPAKIISIGGGDANPVYSINYRGYNQTATLTPKDIRPLPESRKRQLEKDEKLGDREKKKKKYEKKAENKAKKEVEQVDKQANWQAFAKKSVKKGIHIPGVQGESIFASPEGPGGKVGVVGSGKAMTAYQAKGKHKFGE